MAGHPCERLPDMDPHLDRVDIADLQPGPSAKPEAQAVEGEEKDLVAQSGGDVSNRST